MKREKLLICLEGGANYYWKFLFSFVFLLCCFKCFLQTSFGQEFKPPQSDLNATALKGAHVHEGLSSRLGARLFAQTSEHGFGVSKLYGARVPVEKFSSEPKKVDEQTVEQTSLQFLNTNKDFLGIDESALKPARVWSDKLLSGGLLSVVHFNQYYDGIPVLGGVVTLTYRENDLISLSSSFKTISNIQTEPKLSKSEAEGLALAAEFEQKFLPVFPRPEELNDLVLPDPDQVRVESSRLVISTVDGDLQQLRLAWQVNFASTYAPPTQLRYLIDAQMGKILNRENLVTFDTMVGDIAGNIKAEVFPGHPDPSLPFDGQVEIGVPFVRVSHREQTYGQSVAITDGLGEFRLTLPSSAPANELFTIYPMINYNTTFAQPGNVIINIEPDSFPVTAPASVYLNISSIDQSYRKQASNIFYHLAWARYFFGRRFFGGPDSFGVSFFPVKVFLDQSWLNTVPSSVCKTDAATGAFLSQEIFLTGQQNGLGFPVGTFDLESAGLSADIITHEFTHGVLCYLILPINKTVADTTQFFAMWEAYSDYFAASLENDPMVNEGITHPSMIPNASPVSADGTDLVRTLINSYRFDIDYNGFASKYDKALILGGALWSLRSKMIVLYGEYEGRLKADELVINTMKQTPVTYAEFLEVMLRVDDSIFGSGLGAEHLIPICEAFKEERGIQNQFCPEDWTDPPGALLLLNYDITLPQSSTFVIDDPLGAEILGSARNSSAETFSSFSLALRPYGTNTWSSAGVSLTGGGSTPIFQDVLGRISNNTLINSCYYEAKLEVSTSNGVKSDQVVFRKESGSLDPMPRMACVYMTEGHGAENRACEVIAIMSDPKVGYFSLSTNDWRRGRHYLLNGGDNQFGMRYQSMCDPDGAPWRPWWFPDDMHCARDCWNITGADGNNHGGNDGLRDIFCAAGANCGGEPVSFSGCKSDNNSCINNAIGNLESVYHKVLYFHWASGWGGGAVIQDCADDTGEQSYVLDDAWRIAQCSEPRCEFPHNADVFDGMFALADAGLVLNQDGLFSKQPRESGIAQYNCTTCGCPSNMPYCNQTTDNCENKCLDATPFGQCSSVTTGRYCDAGVLRSACGTLCPGASCPIDSTCQADGFCAKLPTIKYTTHDGTLESSGAVTSDAISMTAGTFAGIESRGYFKFDLTGVDLSSLLEAKLLLRKTGAAGAVYTPVLYKLATDYATLGSEDWSASKSAITGNIGEGPDYVIDIRPHLTSGVNAFVFTAAGNGRYHLASNEHPEIDYRPRIVYRLANNTCKPAPKRKLMGPLSANASECVFY